MATHQVTTGQDSRRPRDAAKIYTRHARQSLEISPYRGCNSTFRALMDAGVRRCPVPTMERKTRVEMTEPSDSCRPYAKQLLSLTLLCMGSSINKIETRQMLEEMYLGEWLMITQVTTLIGHPDFMKLIPVHNSNSLLGYLRHFCRMTSH